MQNNQDPRLNPLPQTSTEQHDQFVRDWVYGNHVGEFSPFLSTKLFIGNKNRAWWDSSHPEAFKEYLQNKWGTDSPPLDIYTLISRQYLERLPNDVYRLTPHAHESFAPRKHLYLQIENIQQEKAPKDPEERRLVFVRDWVYRNNEGEFSGALKITTRRAGDRVEWADIQNSEKFSEYLRKKWGDEALRYGPVNIHDLISRGYVEAEENNNYKLTPKAIKRFRQYKLNMPIFVSYAREDIFAVHILVHCLNSLGIQEENIFWDEQLKDGFIWQDKLAKEIQRISESEDGIFIVLFSNYWKLSDFCRREFNHAAKYGAKPLILELGPKSSLQGMPFDAIQTTKRLYEIFDGELPTMIEITKNFLKDVLTQDIPRLDIEHDYITLPVDETFSRLIKNLESLIDQVWELRDNNDAQTEFRYQIEGFYKSFGNNDLNAHIQALFLALDARNKGYSDESGWTDESTKEQYKIVTTYINNLRARLQKSNLLFDIERIVKTSDYTI